MSEEEFWGEDFSQYSLIREPEEIVSTPAQLNS